MSLEKFFSPRSVAIVGASREKGKVGYEILTSMVKGGYQGAIYPVNAKAAEVEGLPCFASLTAIGKTVDLVIIVIPAKFVVGVMKECATLAIKSVVIITAGFKETGEAGKALELEVAAIARQNGIRVVGPNCLGVISTNTRLNGSFGGDLPVQGGIGYMSQSGALMAAILDMANAHKIGFSNLVSFGNKCDVNELDMIKAFGDDSRTTVIAGYLENIIDGHAFAKAAEKVSRHKPILLMKSGGTAAGAKAASSHTGSLAGGDTVYECLFKKAGIVRCHSIKAQFDFAQAFAYQPLPPGSRVVVVTNAGGPGIMAADAIEREGLSFAKLTDETMKKLASRLPPAANVTNPVDVLGDALADRYEFAIDTVLDDPGVDIVLVLLTPQAMTQATQTAQAMAHVIKSKKIKKPLLACFMGASKVAEGLTILRENCIPQYESPETAVKAIKVFAEYAAWRREPHQTVTPIKADKAAARAVIQAHLDKGLREIGETEAKKVLAAYGFLTPKSAIAMSAEEAAAAAAAIGFPVVMKINSPDISHKSDVGGVKVNLATAQAVSDAYTTMMTQIPLKMPAAKLEGVSIQEMCKRSQEIILGVTRDKMGAMLMFGLGGILVEVLKDVTFAMAPLSEKEALAMIESTRTCKILKGVRGQPGVDMDALVQALLRLSQLVTDFPEIKELDINPFMVGLPGQTSVAVDGRMSVEK
ncbi:MAG: acetate--CoA ligase family protein [Kiritimatiellia bacterium]